MLLPSRKRGKQSRSVGFECWNAIYSGTCGNATTVTCLRDYEVEIESEEEINLIRAYICQPLVAALVS